MRRMPALGIQVAQLIVSTRLSRSEMSRRGLARALLPTVVPLVPIRREMFARTGSPSQVAGAVTGSLANTNILLALGPFVQCFDSVSLERQRRPSRCQNQRQVHEMMDFGPKFGFRIPDLGWLDVC